MRFLRSALLCLCVATPVSAETLYGLRTYTGGPNETANVLVTIDTESGQTGIVGPLGLEDYRHVSIGLAGTRGQSLTGVLWDHYADTGKIIDVDPFSGQSTTVRDIRSKQRISYEGMRGLAATSKGQLFSSVDGRLVRINPETGRARLGPEIATEFGPIEISDLSFGGGKLFGSSGYAVYEIDRRSGAATEIGMSMFWEIGSLAHTRKGLYGVSDQGVLLDLRDGYAQAVAPVISVGSLTALRGGGSASRSASASRAPAPVPIPAAGPMLAFAAFGLFAAGRWRRKAGSHAGAQSGHSSPGTP